MPNRAVPALVLIGSLLAPAIPALAQDCLHGPNERAADRSRRKDAVQMAAAINAAEARIIGPKTPAYKPLDKLLNVPPAPRGFELRFYLDESGQSYLFSIRDTLDACRYTVFSDQDGRVYAASPLRGPFILPTR
ncbi:MAG: hypothetical protein ACM3SQ_07610 [Betaproteobacteria bacterium]